MADSNLNEPVIIQATRLDRGKYFDATKHSW